MSASQSVLLALAILLAAAALGALLAAWSRLARATCWITTTLGCAVAGVAALRVLAGADAGMPFTGSWGVPGGVFALRLDALAAWYVLVIVLVGAPCTWHGASYARALSGKKLALFVAGLPLLLAALLLLAAAANALLFLAAWEVMTLAAFLLIVVRHEEASVRAAGWLYLVANHLGSFCLVALIAVLGATAPSFAFADLRAPASVPAWLLLTLWLASFVTKAGVMPVHIWLPHAHPAAPIPISAALSGLVIKAGIFGMLRFLPSVAPPPASAGGVVLALGVGSGVLGVLYALAQHDLKRLLAYHSVENIGIILLGIGAGLLGLESGNATTAALGFAGALLHVLNHAVFKALLFLGAGAVVRATGTAELERLGGLAKRLPHTACLFLIGCAAISGLPPLNGFVSEWLVFRGLFAGAVPGQGIAGLCGATALVALALIGGLALACFAKAFGAVFLGVPREPALAAQAREAPLAERIAMAWLAALCVLIGILPEHALRLVWPAALQLCGTAAGAGAAEAAPAIAAIARAALGLTALVTLLAAARIGLAKGASRRVATWGCGYSLPSARMQYTASSFASPLLGVFARVVGTQVHARPARGVFSAEPSLHTEVRDGAEMRGFRPLYALLGFLCKHARRAQRGPVQMQILYVLVVLTVLLLWKVTL